MAETGEPYAFTGDDPLNATDPLGDAKTNTNKVRCTIFAVLMGISCGQDTAEKPSHRQQHTPEAPVETPTVKRSPKKLPFPRNAFAPLGAPVVTPNPNLLPDLKDYLNKLPTPTFHPTPQGVATGVGEGLLWVAAAGALGLAFG